jgi:hypothetical protein
MCDAKNMELQFVCWFDGFETWSDKIEKNRGGLNVRTVQN